MSHLKGKQVVDEVNTDDVGFLNDHMKIILLGETGSGKSEISINLAALIRQYLVRNKISQEVRFLDMDQTKPLFRSRDIRDDLRAQGITFRLQEQFMDAPVVPYGVHESINDPNLWTILDVGGSQAGALCIGQYSETIIAGKAMVYYTINPYRPFSDSTERISLTMEQILSWSGLNKICIISNPYLGRNTTVDQLLKGNEVLIKLLKPIGKTISLTAIPFHLWETAKKSIQGRVVRIYPYLGKFLRLSHPK